MLELIFECGHYLLNMIVIGGLSWHAFRQSERIKLLSKKLLELEAMREHK